MNRHEKMITKQRARRLAKEVMDDALGADNVAVDYDAKVDVIAGGSAWVTVSIFIPAADIEEARTHGEEAAAKAETPGEVAYTAEVSARPNYPDGSPRKPWSELGAAERDTWERNPTPRWTRK